MASPVQLRAALLQHTSLAEADLSQALKKQEQSGRRLTDLLLELELVPEGELIGALAALYGIPTRETLAPEDIRASRVFDPARSAAQCSAPPSPLREGAPS